MDGLVLVLVAVVVVGELVGGLVVGRQHDN